MTEDELNKIKARNQMLESNNRLLVSQQKETDKEFKLLEKELKKVKSKINQIYNIITTNEINENNYKNAINWIIKTMEE